jgi:hypothetical protein
MYINLSLTKKRIELAQCAQNRATSEWGKAYWDGVIAHLLRKVNLLN